MPWMSTWTAVYKLLLPIFHSKTVIYFLNLFLMETFKVLVGHNELGVAVLFTFDTTLAALWCCMNVRLLMVISPLTDRTE